MSSQEKEVTLTEIEAEVMNVFAKHKVFNDRHCAIILMQLSDKLEEVNAQTAKQNINR